jgi:endonuclease-3
LKSNRRIRSLQSALKKAYPRAVCALDFSTPFELLIATILAAQCTDKRVNKVTPVLFRKYPTVAHFARASLPELEKDIRSTGFFRQKARWVHQTSQRLLDRFHGKVPRTMEELLTLSGVARKTANVVLGTSLGINSGIVVDTHVKRLSGRMGFSKEEDPVKIEQDLMAVVPKKDWIWFGHAMTTHGREFCVARNPRCPLCPLRKWCPYPSKTI